MIIHCTKKLAPRLPNVSPSSLAETSPLGSWHANLIYFDRRQCLFFCHDSSRAVIFVPGVRKPDFQQLGNKIFPDILIGLLQSLGCNPGRLQAARLALGPVRFDAVTDRSVLGSMNIAKRDLEPMIYNVPNVLDLDPVVVSARISRRPARIANKLVWPDAELLSLVDSL